MFRLLLLAVIVVVAILLRFWQIDTIPPGFHFDESFEGLEAWRIATEAAYRPVFLTGNFGVAPLNAYANAISFTLVQLLGGEVGPVVMRSTAGLFGVLGVLAVYGLAVELRNLDRRRLSAAFPLLAAVALATMRWHIHFSRMGIEPILAPLLWAAATWLLLRGWRTGERWSFAACGLLLAASLYAYQGAWIIPFLILPVVAHLWFYDPTHNQVAPETGAAAGAESAQPAGHELLRRRPIGGLVLAAAVALLLVLPLAWFFGQQPDLFLLRPAQIAVVEAPSVSAAGDVGANIRASLMMFVPIGGTGDMDPRRNLPGEAALNWWQFLPFFAGVLLATWRVRNPAYSIPLIGLAGLLLPGVFSEYTPHFHRILGAAAPTALLIGLGLQLLVGMEQRSNSAEKRWRNWGAWTAVAILAVGAVTAARTYFVRWAALPDLFYAFDAGLWEIGRHIAAQPPDAPIYLTPRGADHPTLAFAWATRPGSHGPPVSFDGRQIFPVAQGANAAPETYIAIEGEDFRTRMLLPEVLPTAEVAHTVTDDAGQVYASYYVRPTGAVPGRPPAHTVAAEIGDGVALAGYDVQPATLQPGGVLYLQLHWQVDGTPAQDWTVFTHLLAQDEAGNWVQVAGHDGKPGGGSLATLRWQPGWRVLDEHQIPLPPELPPGAYWLATGFYTPDGAKLPAGGQGIVLGEVVIE